MSDSKFQVNLRGVIDLLSDHLYGSPRVFVRELLQNAVDAITARRQLDRHHQGEIRIELTEATGEGPATLAVEDNGIGLTEEEVHQFLATIGRSSKRGVLEADDFIGQFGIGLLSGFVVSDEIVVVTKSAQADAPAVEWRGGADGVYSVRTLQADIEPGSQVYLRARVDAAEMFEPEFLLDAARHYGSHLPTTITVATGDQQQEINSPPPWRVAYDNQQEAREARLAYGQEVLETDFLDAIPLESKVGGVEGIAFVLPHASSAPLRQSHRVYLKDMLLSEHADGLLPDWAFFVRCVVNATDLRPTASRESFYEDEKLDAAREALGACLRRYLVQLAKHDRAALDRILALHYLPIKALAVDDDEFYQIVIDWLPFETSLGQMTLAECAEFDATIRYTPTRDQFLQISSVAAAQRICIVNAGYTYDQELIEKLPSAFPDRRCEQTDPSQLVQSFESLSLDERDATFDLVRTAELVLQPYRCGAQMQKFEPAELPTLYTANDTATFLRSIEQTKDDADELWSGVLDQIAEQPASTAYSQLTLNYKNRLVRRLAELKDKNLVGRAIEMLYVQSLLLGHYPLGAQESALLGDGMLRLIEYAIDAAPD